MTKGGGKEHYRQRTPWKFKTKHKLNGHPFNLCFVNLHKLNGYASECMSLTPITELADKKKKKS